MRKILTLLLLLSLACSFITIPVSADSILGNSFESADLSNGGWKIYPVYTSDSGKTEYGISSEYKTDGNQSLYMLDTIAADTKANARVDSPRVDVSGNKRGTYTLYADVKVVTGSVTIQLRYYYPDGTYTSKMYTVKENTDFETVSVSMVTPYEAQTVQIVFSSDQLGVLEGYIDNVRVIKTEEYDEKNGLTYLTLKDSVANAKPGDVIEIENGVYKNFLITVNASGEEGNPITIKAKNPGEVVFKEDTCFTINGSYITLEGIRFEECVATNVIKIEESTWGCELKNCAIYNCQSKTWILLRGRKAKISECFFDKKVSKGQMINITKSQTDYTLSDNHIIENCFFGNISQQSENGFEAIKIGDGGECSLKSYTLVSGCFFYKCNGEVETISVKSSSNTIKNNTFYNNQGSIVLRAGDDNEIYGNLYIGGDDTARVAGVRVIGARQSVHDNYFYNLPSKSTVILMFDGTPLVEGYENRTYYPVEDAKIYNNTIIGGNLSLKAGDYYPNDDPAYNRIIAPDGEVYNNAIVSYSGKDTLLVNGDENHTVEFSNNYAYGKEIGYLPEGVTNEYFKLVKDGNYYKPENETIGADLDIVKNAPVNPYEIVPAWIKAKYFDTGLAEFAFVENDPFNSNSHINGIIPFEVSYNVSGEGGLISLKKDGVSVAEESILVYNNPELEFIATPSKNRKVEYWYINGTLVNKSNEEALFAEVKENSLIVKNVSEKLLVQVEFAVDEILPDSLTTPVSIFKGYSNDTLSVINHNGETVNINGCYAAVGAKAPMFKNFPVKEYGFLVSADGVNFNVKAQAMIPVTSDGAYGILFHNFSVNTIYTLKPYVIYYDFETKSDVMVEGDEGEFYVSDKNRK